MSASALDTPPSSDVEASALLPPSPPLSPPKRASPSAVDRLISTLRLHRRGRLVGSGDWLTFSLTPSESAEFRARLRKEPALGEWFREKVRYDWEGEDGRLVLRMPAALHERFTACVEKAIGGAIRALVQELQESGNEADRGVAEELGRIYEGRSTTLELRVPPLENSSSSSSRSQESRDGDGDGAVEERERVVQRSPDASFYHPSQPDLPTLVVEVSYSQQQKDLPRLAESYIICSSHAIRAVLGFKIPYSPRATAQGGEKMQADAHRGKSANYSLWRPGIEYTGKQLDDGSRDTVGICEQVKTEVPLRACRDSHVQPTLDLRLSDLLPKDSSVLSSKRASGRPMTLSFPLQELVALLNEADRTSRAAGAGTKATPTTSRAPTKFRMRKRSPSEELSDGREEMFLRQETREQEKDTPLDGEYVERTRRVRRRKSQQAETKVEELGTIAASGGGGSTAGASRDTG